MVNTRSSKKKFASHRKSSHPAKKPSAKLKPIAIHSSRQLDLFKTHYKDHHLYWLQSLCYYFGHNFDRYPNCVDKNKYINILWRIGGKARKLYTYDHHSHMMCGYWDTDRVFKGITFNAANTRKKSSGNAAEENIQDESDGTDLQMSEAIEDEDEVELAVSEESSEKPRRMKQTARKSTGPRAPRNHLRRLHEESVLRCREQEEREFEERLSRYFSDAD